MTIEQTVSDIKALKIQGATHIAKAALIALQEAVHRSSADSIKGFLIDLRRAVRLLEESRPTEPYLRNVLRLSTSGLPKDSVRVAKEVVHKNIQDQLKQLTHATEVIATIGAKKIPNNSRIFIHCHSSQVMEILKKAKQLGKRFTVVNTEARPFYQGRMSAEELSKAGIPVEHYVDAAAAQILDNVDLFLIGADAITVDGVVNKIGSGLFAEAAQQRGVPVFVCTPALKFDPMTINGTPEPMEERPKEEVWANAPKLVQVHNSAFEFIPAKLITNIISELGIYPHSAFIEEVRRTYPEITTL